jgi:hypothetical protein
MKINAGRRPVAHAVSVGAVPVRRRTSEHHRSTVAFGDCLCWSVAWAALPRAGSPQKGGLATLPKRGPTRGLLATPAARRPGARTVAPHFATAKSSAKSDGGRKSTGQHRSGGTTEHRRSTTVPKPGRRPLKMGTRKTASPLSVGVAPLCIRAGRRTACQETQNPAER